MQLSLGRVKAIAGWLGILLTVSTFFAPLWSLPEGGKLSYLSLIQATESPFRLELIVGGLLVFVAGISAYLVWKKKYIGLWYTGCLIVVLTAFTYFDIRARTSAASGVVGSALASMGYHPQWGFLLPILGAVLLFLSVGLMEQFQISNLVLFCVLLEGLASAVFIVGGVGALFQWFHLNVASDLVIGGMSSLFLISGVLFCLLPFYEGR